MWFRKKRYEMTFKNLDKIDQEMGLHYGYTHAEINALVAPIFGLTAEEMCGILLVGIQHEPDGHHNCMTLSDLPQEQALMLLSRIMYSIAQRRD